MYPYQFPGGTYNQFYGYSSYPKGYPYAQNFGNTGMTYPEEEYMKHRMPNQYYPQQEQPQSGNSLRDSSGKQSGSQNSGKSSGNPDAQSKQTGSTSQMDGNFSQGAVDFYESSYSPLMSPPFYHGAPVNQSYQPQPQQQSGSRNNY